MPGQEGGRALRILRWRSIPLMYTKAYQYCIAVQVGCLRESCLVHK
jgi:hypothetical protein